MSIEREIAEGENAHKLINDAAFDKAFNDLRLAIMEKWEQAPIRDKEGAHELKLMIKLLGDVRANLEQTITAGNVARIELNRSRIGDKVKRWIR